MNAEKSVVYVLANDATFNAHIGGTAALARIYFDEVDQGAVFPQVSVTSESVDPTDTKQNSNFDHDLIQIFHSSATKKTSMQMATDARTALEAASGSLNGLTVNEIRFVDADSFTEKIIDKKIYTVEQLFRVTLNL